MDKKVTSLLPTIFSDEIKWKIRLLENWHSIIGSMGTKVTLLHIREPIVVLGVSHPAWAQELHLLKSVIQDSINSFLGKEYIKNIHFQVVGIQKPSPSVPQDRVLTKKKPIADHRALTFSEEDALHKVKDDDLRAALTQYLAYCKPKK